VLAALPLFRRIYPDEAMALIRESDVGRLDIVALDQAEYLGAITTVTKRGLSSGIVYDTLHVTTAIKTSYERIYTYNIFVRSVLPIILLSTPR